jgi:hypothetical protein
MPRIKGAQAGIRSKVGNTQEEFEVGKEERIHLRRDAKKDNYHCWQYFSMFYFSSPPVRRKIARQRRIPWYKNNQDRHKGLDNQNLLVSQKLSKEDGSAKSPGARRAIPEE